MEQVLLRPVGRYPWWRRHSWSLYYALGCLIGGATIGVLLSLLAAAIVSFGETAALSLRVAAVALAVFAVYRELKGGLGPLPERHAQVPRGWLRWRSRGRVAFAYGCLIGSGIFTYLEHAVAYVVVATLFVLADPELGLALGLVYGGSRGLSLVLMSLNKHEMHNRLSWDWLVVRRRGIDLVLATAGLGCTVSLLLG